LSDFSYLNRLRFTFNRVQNLSLRHCGITNLGAENIGKALGTSIKANLKLVSLNLAGNRISDAGAEHIAIVSCYISQLFMLE